ncbi:MerR family transcriptional regulator [Nonomuraea sp. SMC257]|uniref:MerR family transcriptional regulator n=1 Tax=Nonomuraea montanisoli TaxID=2741721 RepID=A0A7Y6I6H1_9ACTN|nr:helix-turn-helix domain-containing protein [Nonomuraea montanisoli]NUW31359.1 MerR family transcriptional regulator [Nonomuraea montanisoli]
MEETWTIGELAERAAGLLRAGGPNGNGRVREVPGERLIRWYTTIGLVDPPLSRRGRVARYGRRHLLQLVAVKRLQAAGLSIADIQMALAGATDAMLEGAAHPETDLEAPGAAGSASRPDGETDASREAAPGPDRFWARAPRGRAPSPAPAPSLTPAPSPASHRPAPRGPGTDGHDEPRHRDPAVAPEPAPPGGLVRGIRLAPGVTLVLDGSGRTPSTDDVQAVLGAAAPLLAVLEERKLA